MKFPRASLVVVLACAMVAFTASPALARPQRVTPGWSPAKPPVNTAEFAQSKVTPIIYGVTCGQVMATGWSAFVTDNPDSDLDSNIVTTGPVSQACFDSPGSLVVRQEDDTFVSQPYNFGKSGGVIAVFGHQPYATTLDSPVPRVGQWMAIGARSPDGAALPMLELRVTSVGDDTFAVDRSIDESYLGGPVLDNVGRVLGLLSQAGNVITGTPQFCGDIFWCPDESWLDITAPSRPRNVKATPGKRSVTVTWQAVASDGGSDVVYWYHVGNGPWTKPVGNSVTVKALSGTRVSVTVQAQNMAGPGPAIMVWATAK